MTTSAFSRLFQHFTVPAAAVLLVGALVVPSAALAQSKGKKSRSVTFEDDVIEANYLRPDVAAIDTKSKDKRASLIRIRTNFFAELYRSAEDL